MYIKGRNSKNAALTAASVCLVVMFVFPCLSMATEEQEHSHEYRLKATFMYQFVNFVDGWKFEQHTGEENTDDKNGDKLILVGIIGKDPFGDSFKPLMAKPIRDRKIDVRRFKGFAELNSKDKKVTIHPEVEGIKKCDLLFVCASERKYIDEILSPIRNLRILTIADTGGFLEKGGIINFVIEDHKVRFEINIAGAKRAKMIIRSKLLRLATRVIMEDDVEEEK